MLVVHTSSGRNQLRDMYTPTGCGLFYTTPTRRSQLRKTTLYTPTGRGLLKATLTWRSQLRDAPLFILPLGAERRNLAHIMKVTIDVFMSIYLRYFCLLLVATVLFHFSGLDFFLFRQ